MEIQIDQPTKRTVFRERDLQLENDQLRRDLQSANKEIEKLKQFAADLDHDLNAAIKDCNDHHGEW